MIRAVSLDLDDTLWPIAPVIDHAERTLHGWLETHCPAVAHAWPIEAMRALRDRVWREHPHLAHDFTELRRISLRHALSPFGHDESWVERAFAVFFDARHRVTLYDDAAPALSELAARYPLASLSNGNADLERIGLGAHFTARVSARETGVAKPDARIFARVAEKLGVEARHIAHVGDDPEMDVLGARDAGFVAVWLNRHDAPWPHARAPHITIRSLAELPSALASFTPPE